MKIAFLTLGCKVNSYETEKMKQNFEEAGHQIVSFSERADVYIINTCTVTNIADRKSRQMLHRARRDNPDAVVAATGCYVDSAADRGEREEGIDFFVANKDKENIVEILEKSLAERKYVRRSSGDGVQEEARMSEQAEKEQHTRAYIKVQSGCNQYCAYCIIPYVRGELSSRPDKEIVREAEELAGRRFREIVVTGIHLSSFGVDRQAGKIESASFVELGGRPLLVLLKRLEQIEGIERIRLGSLEPRIITEDFVRELSQIKKLCPHFHLSLQSGCDATLQRMNRHYTTGEYLQGVKLLRQYFENPAVTTDIIVGFPQEGSEEFEETCRFAKEAAFAMLHVFKYSRRQGTVADAMEGQIDGQIKKSRSDKLLELGRLLEQEYQQHFIGRREKVLLEEAAEIGGRRYLIGYNERYVRIAVAVEDLTGEYGDIEEEWCNRIVEVVITGRLTEEILQGSRKVEM